jgi:hypothetical protein
MYICIRCGAFMAVKIHSVVLWIVTLCTLLSGYRRFGVMHCLHLQTQPENEYRIFPRNVDTQI